MKVKEMFDINQGHQITDEEIYNTEGIIPVITARNEIKGHWNKSIVVKDDIPCITYPTKANSGEAYVQYDIFDANNTAVLIPKKEWREKIFLEWFAYKLSKTFLKIATSKEGVNYLNREIVEEMDFDIPSIKDQKKEYQSVEKLIKIRNKLVIIFENVDSILNKEIVI